MPMPKWYKEDTHSVDNIDFNQDILEALGQYPQVFDVTPVPIEGDMPVTLRAGVPRARVFSSNDISPSTGGFVPKLQREPHRGTMDSMFLGSRSIRGNRGELLKSVAHETEHMLTNRQAPAGEGSYMINRLFDQMIDPRGRKRAEFVRTAVKNGPYLKEKYGSDSAYFTPQYMEFQGLSRYPLMLFEQFAELSAIEQTHGVDLTKDPVLRDSLFADKDVREAYNALTGLRQTRLDAKDIAPYTRIPEKEGPGYFDRMKEALMTGYSLKQGKNMVLIPLF